MKPRLVDLLACPTCEGDLRLAVAARDGDEIRSGTLTCSQCVREFPIVRGIPRLLPPEITEEKKKTAAAFAYEWLNFTELHGEYEEQFLDWIKPLPPDFFKGKVVLDAGCGTGRHSWCAANYGAAEVIGMDLSDAVETAYANVAHLPNLHVVQADIYHPPFKGGKAGGPFDFVYSIGVLHHLPDPRGGFESLLRFVKPGGTIFGWVYGHENNGVVHHFINPVRRGLTARLPPPVTKALAWPLTIVMQGVIHGLYRPLRNTGFGRWLPSSAYLNSLAQFTFRQNYSIVFDHLVAPTAFYIKREDYERWFSDNGLTDVELSWRNENSWRGRGSKAGLAAD